jgi:hypothetical protein
MTSRSDDQWASWTARIKVAHSAADVRSRLLAIADVIANHVPRPDTPLWELLGVDLVRVRLVGRRGSMIERWNARIVVVDEREPRAAWDYIVAHEAAHLLLGAVHRSGRFALGRDEEERMCDDFARVVSGTPVHVSL